MLDHKQDCLARHAQAVCLSREAGGRVRYRISPRPVAGPDDVPHVGYLSGWCTSEARAWEAASRRYWAKVWSRESW